MEWLKKVTNPHLEEKKTKTNKRGLTIYQITTHFKSNLGTVPTRKNHA